MWNNHRQKHRSKTSTVENLTAFLAAVSCNHLAGLLPECTTATATTAFLEPNRRTYCVGSFELHLKRLRQKRRATGDMLERKTHVAILTVMLQHGLSYDATSNACACKPQGHVNISLQRQNELHTNRIKLQWNNGSKRGSFAWKGEYGEVWMDAVMSSSPILLSPLPPCPPSPLELWMYASCLLIFPNVPLSPTCFATLPGSRIPLLITSTGAMSPYSSQNIHPWLQYTDNFITFKGCAPNGLPLQEQSESQSEGKNPICSHVAMSYFPMSPSPCVSPLLQFRKRESRTTPSRSDWTRARIVQDKPSKRTHIARQNWHTGEGISTAMILASSCQGPKGAIKLVYSDPLQIFNRDSKKSCRCWF